MSVTEEELDSWVSEECVSEWNPDGKYLFNWRVPVCGFLPLGDVFSACNANQHADRTEGQVIPRLAVEGRDGEFRTGCFDAEYELAFPNDFTYEDFEPSEPLSGHRIDFASDLFGEQWLAATHHNCAWIPDRVSIGISQQNIHTDFEPFRYSMGTYVFFEGEPVCGDIFFSGRGFEGLCARVPGIIRTIDEPLVTVGRDGVDELHTTACIGMIDGEPMNPFEDEPPE